MRAFFCVRRGGNIVRTGRVPSDLVAAQAVDEWEAAIAIDGDYPPGALFFDGDVVRRKSDNAQVSL